MEIVRGQLTAEAKGASGQSRQLILTPTQQQVETPTPSPEPSSCDDPTLYVGETLVYKNFTVVAKTGESKAQFERTNDGASFTFCNVGVETGNGLLYNFGATGKLVVEEVESFTILRLVDLTAEGSQSEPTVIGGEFGPPPENSLECPSCQMYPPEEVMTMPILDSRKVAGGAIELVKDDSPSCQADIEEWVRLFQRDNTQIHLKLIIDEVDDENWPAYAMVDGGLAIIRINCGIVDAIGSSTKVDQANLQAIHEYVHIRGATHDDLSSEFTSIFQEGYNLIKAGN